MTSDGAVVSEVIDDDRTEKVVVADAMERRSHGQDPAWVQGMAQAASRQVTDDCWSAHMRTREERERALPIGGDDFDKGQTTTDLRATVREMKAV